MKCNLHSYQLKNIRIHWSLNYLRSVVLTLLGGMLILTVLGATPFWIGRSFTRISLLLFSFSFCVTQGLSWALTAYINWANCSSLRQLLQGAYRSYAGVRLRVFFFSFLGEWFWMSHHKHIIRMLEFPKFESGQVPIRQVLGNRQCFFCFVSKSVPQLNQQQEASREFY